MKVLSKDNDNVLSEEMSWTLERTQGYVEGERYRRQSLAISVYHKVGIDEYALGFRAGYYRQDDPLSEANIQKKSSAR